MRERAPQRKALVRRGAALHTRRESDQLCSFGADEKLAGVRNGCRQEAHTRETGQGLSQPNGRQRDKKALLHS